MSPARVRELHRVTMRVSESCREQLTRKKPFIHPRCPWGSQSLTSGIVEWEVLKPKPNCPACTTTVPGTSKGPASLSARRKQTGVCLRLFVLSSFLPTLLPLLSGSPCNYPFYQGERPCNSVVEALTRELRCFQVCKEKGNPARIGNLIHQASLDRPH